MQLILSALPVQKSVILLALLLCLLACKKDGADTGTGTKTYSIKGKIEKGPFVKGSKVTVRELTKDLAPTGSTFNTVITDDEGAFVLNNIELQSTFIEVSADGYFYNEVSGDLSTAPITLTGLADLSDGSNVNVNTLTHITRERTLQLIEKQQLTLSQATEKAQEEFLSVFGLRDVGAQSFNSYTITAGTPQAAAQIVISSILLKDRSEAQFAEYVYSLASQFKVNGTVDEPTKQALWEASINLNYNLISEQLIQRYASLDRAINVVNLNRFVDWNHDGIAGNELGNIGETPLLKFETDTLRVGKAGGTFTVKVTSNLPYQQVFSKGDADHPDDIHSEIHFVQQTIGADGLTLQIGPSRGVFMRDQVLTIASYDQQTTASVVIHQEGDLDKMDQDPVLAQFLNGILLATVASADLNYTAEAAYGHTVYPSGWTEFYQNRVSAQSTRIKTMWTHAYKAIREIHSFLSMAPDPSHFPVFAARLLTLRSILYYQMTILWGNVHYVTALITDPHNIPPQITTSAMWQQLETRFREGNNLLASQVSKGGIPHSNDIPKQMLARVLLHQKKYAEALLLLEEIINAGRYTLVATGTEALQADNPELIYSLHLQNGSEFKKINPDAVVLPLLRFSETLLLASECAFHLGQQSKAIEYLNRIEAGRSRSPKYALGSSIDIQAIALSWKNELPIDFSYFDFLKRNGLAESTLSLTGSYQLLLPIPLSELVVNPGAVQNPGY